MKINKNKLFRSIHIYVSLFFLPLAIIYAFTGIAYICGIKDDYKAQIKTYNINTDLTQINEDNIIKILQENNIKIPSNTTLKPNNKTGGYSMGGVHYSININHKNGLNISTRQNSIIGDLILLHKNKGVWYFSILAIGFGIALVMLYVSGLIITLLAIKKDRNKQLYTLLAGVVVTIILAYFSL